MHSQAGRDSAENGHRIICSVVLPISGDWGAQDLAQKPQESVIAVTLVPLVLHVTHTLVAAALATIEQRRLL